MVAVTVRPVGANFVDLNGPDGPDAVSSSQFPAVRDLAAVPSDPSALDDFAIDLFMSGGKSGDIYIGPGGTVYVLQQSGPDWVLVPVGNISGPDGDPGVPITPPAHGLPEHSVGPSLRFIADDYAMLAVAPHQGIEVQPFPKPTP